MAELRVLQIDGERAVGVELTRPDGRVVTQSPPRDDAAAALAALANAHPNDDDVAWIDVRLRDRLRPPQDWPILRRHDLEWLHLGDVDPATPAIRDLGWIDFESPYLLSLPTHRRRPTWLVSPRAGLVRAALLQAAGFDPRLDWPIALADAARRSLPHGLFPIAEPDLALDPTSIPYVHGFDTRAAARILRRALDRRWIAIWLLAHLLFRRRLPIASALIGWRTPAARPVDRATFTSLRPSAPEAPRDESEGTGGVDVIIPSLGRAALVEQALGDLADQTRPPARVIVIDQRPVDPSGDDSAWNEDAEPTVEVEPSGARPFVTEWLRVEWMGACRARNLGLERIFSQRRDDGWVLLLDDDIRLAPDFIARMLETASAYGVDVVLPRAHLAGEENADHGAPVLWERMGGFALLSRRACRDVGGFDRRLDGGYGEDFELGMRLRQYGHAVVYDPSIPALHLKAPDGGFRRPYPHPWPQDGSRSPKPSPTVLLSRHLHQRRTMRQGFLLYFVLAHLRSTPPWRWPISVPTMIRRWRASRRWTARLQRSSPT